MNCANACNLFYFCLSNDDKGQIMKEAGFKKLVNEHKSTIYSVCFMFAKKQEEANDLFQEVLISLWKGYDSFRGECSERTWVYRVSLNSCINANKKQKLKIETVPLDININLYKDDDSDSQQAQALYEKIHRLDVFNRSIVLLWLEGLPYQEIGEVVGISANNVGVRLARIREQLKKMNNE